MTDFFFMNTQKWLVQKESDNCSERKSWNDFSFSAESTFQESVSKKHFCACPRAKISDVAAYIPSSAKLPYTSSVYVISNHKK